MMHTKFFDRRRGAMLLAAACAIMLAAPASTQDRPSLQKLFEAGQYDGALQRVAEEREHGHQSLESTFIAALTQDRLEQADRARGEYERLANQDNPSWKMIGKSGCALASGNADDALAAATEAVRLEENLGYAHFQLGIVHARRNNHGGAAQSFARAAELMPSFAYAHYYAGLAYQRVKNINRMAAHFETFLQLAPNAPERLAVIAIMRSVRG